MFYAGLDLPAQWWILYRGYGNAVLSVSTPNIFTWQALIMSVLLYGAETWTFLVADMNTLQAIRMRFQRQVLDVRWWAHISNAEMLQRSGLSTIGDILRNRRFSLFGHVARLDPGVPAHDALRLMVDTYEGRNNSWRRPPGRPRNVWLNKV